MTFAVRVFPTAEEAALAYSELGARLLAGMLRQRGANLSASMGLDPDSARAYVVVYGPDADDVEREAERVGGEPVDAELEPELRAGLIARREQSAADGPGLRRFDGPPAKLRADGTREAW